MSVEPTTSSPRTTRLPLACRGNATCATTVTTSGYTTPVITVSSARRTMAGLSCEDIGNDLRSDEAARDQHEVDRLDAYERGDDAPETVDEQVVAQEHRGAHGAVAHAAQRERDQRHDDERVEDHRRQDGALGRGQPH